MVLFYAFANKIFTSAKHRFERLNVLKDWWVYNNNSDSDSNSTTRLQFVCIYPMTVILKEIISQENDLLKSNVFQ